MQKTHFWSDYYSGQLSSYGLHTLNSLCDRAIDTPNKFIDLKSIKSHIIGKNRLRIFLNIIRNYIHKCEKYLPWFYIKDEKYQNEFSQIFKKFFHYYLPISFVIILIECIIIIYQLHINYCNNISNKNIIKFHIILEILSSLLFIFDYIQLYYWFYYNKKRKYSIVIFIWIILYIFSITCRLLSCIIYLIIFLNGLSKKLCIIFYIFKYLSLIQCIIFCLFIIEFLRLFVDYMVNRYVSISYDIGLAYISSEEQIYRIIHRLTDNGKIFIK